MTLINNSLSPFPILRLLAHLWFLCIIIKWAIILQEKEGKNDVGEYRRLVKKKIMPYTYICSASVHSTTVRSSREKYKWRDFCLRYICTDKGLHFHVFYSCLFAMYGKLLCVGNCCSELFWILLIPLSWSVAPARHGLCKEIVFRTIKNRRNCFSQFQPQKNTKTKNTEKQIFFFTMKKHNFGKLQRFWSSKFNRILTV